MRICFDMDGVIATIVPDGDYSKAEPIQAAIDLINALYKEGHHIIISTARGAVSMKDWAVTTAEQLKAWGVRYDMLDTRKVGADYYVDDKAASLEWLQTNLLKEKGNENKKQDKP